LLPKGQLEFCACATLIYLDAISLDVSGRSIFADANPERMAAFEVQISDGGFTVEPDLFDATTDDPEKMRVAEFDVYTTSYRQLSSRCNVGRPPLRDQ